MFCLSSFVIGSPVECENTKNPAQRVVLAELFTSTTCSHCPYSEAAIEQLSEEYGPSKLAVLEYHAGGEFYTEDSSNRAKYYFGPTGTGTPDMIFDGVIEESGSTDSVEEDYDRYKPHIDDRLSIPSSFEIMLSPSIVGNVGKITAYIKAVANPEKSNLKVRFVVFENNVYYTEGDGGPYYQFVVRDVLEEESLSLSKAGESETFTKTFSISSSWSKEELGVVVFIQTDKNAGTSGLPPRYRVDDEVLQASICKFGVSLTSDKNSEDVGSGGTATFEIDMKNMMSTTETYNVFLEKNLASGWDASYTACTGGMCYSNPSTITLSPNETAEIEIDVVSSADSEPGDSGTVIFTVISQTNPYVKSSIILKTTILPQPTQPTLTSESASTTSITISWTKNTDSNFNRYEIHMSASSRFIPSNTTLVKTLTNQNTVSWEVTGLTENTEYYFKLRVYDTNNQYSDSNEINAKTSKTETEGGRRGIPGFDAGMIIFALGIIFIFRKRFFNED